MRENNLSISNLHHLLDYEVQKFNSAEVQLRNSLNEWIHTATSVQLKNVLQRYLDFVKEHLQKMEIFMEEEQATSISLVNKVMQALIEEADEKISHCGDAEVKDACLLAAVQIINHYKISIYGTAAAFARTLGMEKQAAVFHEAEVNEKQIDDRLSQLAEHEINIKARAPIVLPG
ncbi:MAG TPA: DUF892 family protein [Chitinophagaceae bacterium]|nr:DUF892 family protein [Chitinophagaceae bacterium]